MPINPSIPLQTTTPDSSQGINALAGAFQYKARQKERAQEMEMRKKEAAGNEELRAAQIANLKFQQLGARDQWRTKSNVLAAAQLNNFLDAGDTEGGLAFLQTRKSQIEQAKAIFPDLDTNETDRAIEELKSGDVEKLKEVNKKAIQFGQMIGVLQKPEKDAAGFTLGEGQQRYDAQGKLIAQGPVSDKPPQTREVKVGNNRTITQEWDAATKQYKTIATSSTGGSGDSLELFRAKERIKREEEARGKEAIAAPKLELLNQSKEIKSQIISGKVDKAIEQVDKWFTTGFFGQLLSNIGGTDARNLKSTIDTIQANLGFEELQAMRNSSPTGGALGQVAVRELEMLQSTVASLDIAQDDDQLRENLNAVKVHIMNWKNAVNTSMEEQKKRGPRIGRFKVEVE